jgi:hypothetical protein
LKIVLITLFEAQIIRNFLSNNITFLKNVSINYDVIIFTDKSNSATISNLLKYIDCGNISIVEFDNFATSSIYKFCSSILKWTHQSSSIYREILSTGQGNKKSRFRTPVKMLLHLSLRNSHVVEKLVKSVILKTFNISKFNSYLGAQTADLVARECESLFVTSLTNVKDIHVALYAKIMKIHTIGTVRSWDNLSSHGRLVVNPDVFYSHSDFMSYTLEKFHPYLEFKVHTLVAPNYQKVSYTKKSDSSEYKVFKVGYACMGARVNPDDYRFAVEFNKLAKSFPNQVFYLIQHPSFPHEIEFVLNVNVKIIRFDYGTSSLEDYYTELSTFDLILGGGTSALLDAAVLKVPVIYIGFEYQRQGYWNSALRYQDYMYHFKQFIQVTNIHVCKSHSELVRILQVQNYSLYMVNSVLVTYFSGSIVLDLPSRLIELINQK